MPLRFRRGKLWELIQELEMKRLRDFEAKVQELECELEGLAAPPDPTNLVRRLISTGSRADALRAVLSQPYLHPLPEVVRVRLAEDVPSLDDDGARRVLKRLPLPRATRRVLFGSKRWVVHLCSGKVSQNDMIKWWCHEHKCEILHLDILNKGGRGWGLDRSGRSLVCAPVGSSSRSHQGNIFLCTLKVFGVWDHQALIMIRSGPVMILGVRRVLMSVRFGRTYFLVQDMFLWTVASVAQGRGIPFFEGVFRMCRGVKAIIRQVSGAPLCGL